MPAFRDVEGLLQMTTYIMNEIKVNEHILDDDKYLLIFSVEEVNRLVREGMRSEMLIRRSVWTLRLAISLMTRQCIIRTKAVSATSAMMKYPV